MKTKSKVVNDAAEEYIALTPGHEFSGDTVSIKIRRAYAGRSAGKSTKNQLIALKLHLKRHEFNEKQIYYFLEHK